MQIQINGEKVLLTKYTYRDNDRVALVTEKDNEPYATLTVNLPDAPIEDDEVAIDVNNLGMGIINELVEQSIIDYPKPDKWVQSGYVSYPICKLLI